MVQTGVSLRVSYNGIIQDTVAMIHGVIDKTCNNETSTMCKLNTYCTCLTYAN